MVFVLGARNPRASSDFEIEKKITKEMLRQPTTGDVRYGLVVYDSEGTSRLSLKAKMSKNNVRHLLDFIPWRREGTNVDKGVQAGVELFKEVSPPGTTRLMVVFINGRTDSSRGALDDAKKSTAGLGIKVIVVGLGSRVDPGQLNKLITNGDDVILINVMGDEGDVTRKVKEAAVAIGETSKKGNVWWCGLGNFNIHFFCGQLDHGWECRR